jgi:general secretion pathway protein D
VPKLTNLFSKILLLSLAFTLLSCAQNTLDPIDQEAGLTFNDYEKSFIKDRKKEKSDKAQKIRDSAPIPSISKLVLAPPPPKVGGNKTISFSVTDQVPLKDVLIELGRVAKIDVDVDPNISGGIILNAKNRPLKEVIDRIASLGQLRYSYKNDVLCFEKDSPYMKNYFVDFLSGSQLWGDVESNLTSTLSSAASAVSGDGASASATGSKITSNKSAGIISIYATKAQHENIIKYLDDVYKIASAQVLIEAKVVEVTLKKEFSAGIDWNWVEAGKSVTTNFGAPESPTITAIIPKVKLLGLGGNISATIKALEEFGTARAISSPRISAINNQKAVLDFSENLIYFTISASSSTSTGTSTSVVSTITATKNEVPIGVQLAITPSINLETDEVTLDIKPKLSVNSGSVAVDPSVNPNTGKSLGNTIPIIKTRELNTIAKVKSGSVLVIGGLMTEASINNDRGIPFLGRIPVLGWLFKLSSRKSDIVETVIFVKATIINNGAPPSKYDREFYDKFTTDKKQF